MKKTNLPFSFFLVFIISCTFEKGEVVQPIKDCVIDSTIHIVSVAIEDDFFLPATITIVAGDTVKWTYASGGSAHTTTCDGTGGTSLPPGGTSWDSGVLSPGDPSFKKSISVPGNYTYICVVHGTMMTGTIIVKPRCK